MLTWSNESRKLSDLIPAKYNPRKLSEKDRQDLKNSIEKFNLADPIIINKNNVIIGGHMRYLILKDRNVQDVDVRVPDRLLSEIEEKELNLRLNKNTGDWDETLLLNFDPDFLTSVGFDGDFVDAMIIRKMMFSLHG